MNAIISLGKFERVPMIKAWPTEDRNFTPWLAEPSTISLLGDALDMELEVEAVERWVGSFRADILARAVEETIASSSRTSSDTRITSTWDKSSPI